MFTFAVSFAIIYVAPAVCGNMSTTLISFPNPRKEAADVSPRMAVKGKTLFVTSPGRITDIFDAIVDKDIDTILLANGWYASPNLTSIGVDNVSKTVTIAPLQEKTVAPINYAIPDPSTGVYINGTFDLSEMEEVTMQNVNIFVGKENEDFPTPIKYTGNGIVLTLEDVSLNSGHNGNALSIDKNMVVEATNLTLNGRRGQNSPPLVILPTVEASRTVLRATGSVTITGYDTYGTAVSVAQGVGEILGSSASWYMEGTVFISGDHSPVAPYNAVPGKIMFGDTTISSKNSFPVLIFAQGKNPRDENGEETPPTPPGLAFVSFDSILVKQYVDCSEQAPIDIQGLDPTVDNLALDTGHGITIRIGSLVECLMTDEAQYFMTDDPAWTMNGNPLMTGVSSGVIKKA